MITDSAINEVSSKGLNLPTFISGYK